VTHDEAHDAGGSVLGGVGNHRKAAHHLAAYQVIVGTMTKFEADKSWKEAAKVR
jgi:hypothetical protein